MRMLILIAVLIVGCAAPARSADDIAAAKAIITSQADAMGRDDAAAAYSYASPAIQGVFTNPDSFMSMVRKNYAPVYRHKTFEFGESKEANGEIAQRVHIVDAEGTFWEALYTLQQQPDGSLKIIGCVLLKAGQAV